MTALLHYSISSKLTDDEIKEIDKQISKNQKTLKSLFLNSQIKIQKVLANGMLVFQLSQPLLYTGIVPLPPSVERLLPIEQDKILSDKIQKDKKEFYYILLCLLFLIFWPVKSTGSIFSTFSGSILWISICILSFCTFFSKCQPFVQNINF